MGGGEWLSQVPGGKRCCSFFQSLTRRRGSGIHIRVVLDIIDDNTAWEYLARP